MKALCGFVWGDTFSEENRWVTLKKFQLWNIRKVVAWLVWYDRLTNWSWCPLVFRTYGGTEENRRTFTSCNLQTFVSNLYKHLCLKLETDMNRHTKRTSVFTQWCSQISCENRSRYILHKSVTQWCHSKKRWLHFDFFFYFAIVRRMCRPQHVYTVLSCGLFLFLLETIKHYLIYRNRKNT